MTAITVVIPVYNRAPSIGRALDCVLGETPPGCAVNVIVVDDASSDDLAAALAPYGDRVTRIRHTANSGPAAARNTGIAAATGDYVAFLDSDDAWLPGKLAAQIAAMRRNGWKACCTAYYLAHRGAPEVLSPRYGTTRALTRDDAVWGCFVSPGSTLLCERAVYDEIGGLDPAMRRLEDWEWMLRYTAKYPLGFLAEPFARIEPSHHQDVAKVLEAIEIMRARHLPAMAGAHRRHFAAALDVERAAAYHRRGVRLPAAAALLRSLLRSPLRNDALAAVLHNRVARF
jgi:glycosyltransferase involved in cell wall biosynthesis